MKYIFILGRNVELSIKEVESYFENYSIKYSKIFSESNLILFDIENLPSDLIEKLGGTIAIAEILCEAKNELELEKELEKKELFFGNSNKLNYVIWNYYEDDFLSSYLKERFRNEKLKATEKKLSKNFLLQDNTKGINPPKSSLINEQYVILNDTTKIYFGRIVQFSNYSDIEKRDMNKPVRRESLAISPRISKIMINLSQVKKEEILLDPFCGIGVVLSEALLQKIKVVGIDKDKLAIEGTKKNLKWFGFNEKYYKLIEGDSSKVRIEKINGIATEPDLGETLKKIITKEKAKKTLENFENLIISVINNLKKNISGKIVFSAPYIKTNEGRIGADFSKISMKTGYSIKNGFPIAEFREDQIVGRQIVVLN